MRPAKYGVLSVGLLLVMAILILSLCPKNTMRGVASFYGDGEKLNEYTASGDRFDPEALACASWDYPFNTILKVTCIKTGLSTTVKVNDRGPAKWTGRIIDLTKKAFAEIADLRWGLTEVKIEVLEGVEG